MSLVFYCAEIKFAGTVAQPAMPRLRMFDGGVKA